MKKYKSIYESKLFSYGINYRPPYGGGAPEGFTKYDDSLKAKKEYRHGILYYPKELSDKEIDSFELHPIGDKYLNRTIFEINKKLGRYKDKYLQKENEELLIEKISEFLTDFPFHLKTHVDNIKIIKDKLK